MKVREATGSEYPAVMNVLDGAMLAADGERVRERIEQGRVLVAVEDDRVLGALSFDGPDPANVDAIAVRRARRGQGIGSALVEAVAARADAVTASFDSDVRPFYESLGFTVEPADEDGRLRGVLR